MTHEPTDDARARLEDQINYSIDLQRIIESLCTGQDIVEPKTTARHHYYMAVSYQSKIRDALQPHPSTVTPDEARAAFGLMEERCDPLGPTVNSKKLLALVWLCDHYETIRQLLKERAEGK